MDVCDICHNLLVSMSYHNNFSENITYNGLRQYVHKECEQFSEYCNKINTNSDVRHLGIFCYYLDKFAYQMEIDMEYDPLFYGHCAHIIPLVQNLLTKIVAIPPAA